MGSSDEDESSSSSGSETTAASRQVQFGVTQISVETFESEDEEDEDEFEVHEGLYEDTVIENVNEKLRHQAPQIEHRVQTKHLSRVMASVCTILIQMSHQQVSMLRKLNRFDKVVVNLDYVPLEEKYQNLEFEVEVILDESEEFLIRRKFMKDVSWIEKILQVLIVNLQRSFYYEDFFKILEDDEMTRQQEQAILKSKTFNQNEVRKLRTYIDDERFELSKSLQKVTEKLGNLKDELNDKIVENQVKIEYLNKWQDARHEQNSVILRNKENRLTETTKKMNLSIGKENRVHDEMWTFLEDALKEYKQDIEKWMDKYDKDMDDQEKAGETMKIKLETQREKYESLEEEYNKRQKEMDDYKQHKIEMKKEAEELQRRTRAATKIQAWWRGTMFRKGLGPYRRKKGKGKKGGSAKKNSGQNKKK